MRAGLLILFAIGCSSSTHEAPPVGGDSSVADSGPELTPEELAKQLADAICTDAAACCKPIADCQATVEKRIRDAVKPTLSYDPKAAAGCVAYYRSLPNCTDRETAKATTAYCFMVLDGTKKPGEACTSVEECTRNANSTSKTTDSVGCGSPKEGDPTVCMTFERTGNEGADCDTPIAGRAFMRELCRPDLGCISGKCAKLPVEGEPCSGRCASAVCDMGTCKKLPTAGEPCVAGTCAPGAICMGSSCVDEPKMIPFACLGFPCPSDGTCM